MSSQLHPTQVRNVRIKYGGATDGIGIEDRGWKECILYFALCTGNTSTATFSEGNGQTWSLG